MPVKKGNPLSISAQAVREIGEAYRGSRLKHDATHDTVAKDMGLYSPKESSPEDRLAHWSYLMAKVRQLNNVDTMLFKGIVDLFNLAFAANVTSYETPSGMSATSKAKTPSQVAGEMGEVLGRYNVLDNVGSADHLDLARILRIGMGYHAGCGFFHKARHDEVSARLKKVTEAEAGDSPEQRWNFLAETYGELETHGTYLAARIRSLCKDAFGSEPDTGHVFRPVSCKAVAEQIKVFVKKHYDPDALVVVASDDRSAVSDDGSAVSDGRLLVVELSTMRG